MHVAGVLQVHSQALTIGGVQGVADHKPINTVADVPMPTHQVAHGLARQQRCPADEHSLDDGGGYGNHELLGPHLGGVLAYQVTNARDPYCVVARHPVDFVGHRDIKLGTDLLRRKDHHRRHAADRYRYLLVGHRVALGAPDTVLLDHDARFARNLNPVIQQFSRCQLAVADLKRRHDRSSNRLCRGRFALCRGRHRLRRCWLGCWYHRELAELYGAGYDPDVRASSTPLWVEVIEPSAGRGAGS